MNQLNHQKSFFSRSSFFSQSIILVGLILVGFIFASLLTVAVGNWLGEDLSSTSLSYLRLSQIIASMGSFLLPALIFGYLFDRKWFSFSLANHLPKLNSVLIVILLSICLIPIVSVLAHWNEQLHLPEIFANIEAKMKAMEEAANEVLAMMVSDPSVKNLLINLAVMAVLPALCEEFLFRGTIQPLIQSSTQNKHVAIWITAFIFSAIHLQFYGFFPRMLLGAYLGYLLVWSGSLWLPILAHFLQNAISIITNFFMTRSKMETEELTPSDIPYFPIIVIGTFVILIIGLITLHRQKQIRR